MQTPIQQEYQEKMIRLARAKKAEMRRLERKGIRWLAVALLICGALLVLQGVLTEVMSP